MRNFGVFSFCQPNEYSLPNNHLMDILYISSYSEQTWRYKCLELHKARHATHQVAIPTFVIYDYSLFNVPIVRKFMPLTFPLNFAIKALSWIYGKITSLMFKETWQRSHIVSANRRRLGSHWRKFAQGVEYSIYLAQYTDPEPRISKIAFRTENKEIAHLSLIFEAESNAARFQETISICDLNQKPIVWTLNNIPFQNIPELHQLSWPRFSWDSYRIKSIKSTLTDGRIISSPDTLPSNLTHSWFLNSTWEYRWNRHWNLDAIQSAKTELGLYWKLSFGMPSIRVYSPNGFEATLMERITIVTTRPIAWVMGTKSAIALQFWLSLWLKISYLSDEGRLIRNRKSENHS